MKKSTKQETVERKILREIGWFVYLKNNNDITKAMAELSSYRIHAIHYSLMKRVLTINLERPGLLIGKGGENIDALTEYLTESLKLRKPIQIKIKEDRIYDSLTFFNC